MLKNLLTRIHQLFKRIPLNESSMVLNHRRIFCVGMNKTGTTSLHEGLLLLGYKSVHYYLNGKEPREGWIRHIQLSPYQAYSDWPMCGKDFFAVLDKAFPGSQFILTVRENSQVWQESAEKFFEGTAYSHLYQKEKTLPDRVREYEAHNQQVRDFFKGRKDFLELNFDSGDKWEKLCFFLNKEVPCVPFPHIKPQKPVSSSGTEANNAV